MPSVLTEQGIVHYEVAGTGPPVILLHGWTQAWNTWLSTLETFQDRYRIYAPDLWGFGESDKARARFEVPSFVDMVRHLMDELGMERAPIMGHSMGGTTALGVALTYPERVEKVAVVGSPVNGRSLSFFLKLAGRRAVANLILAGEGAPLLRLFLRLWSPFVSRQNPQVFYEMTVKNAAGFTTESFFSSIDSLRRTDYTSRLHEIQAPAMAIYGLDDVVVSPDQLDLFARHLPHSIRVPVPRAGHFVMWDQPADFNRAFLKFMAL